MSIILIFQAFSQRRKKLKNKFPDAHKMGLLEKWADLRAEELTPNNFLELFKRI